MPPRNKQEVGRLSVLYWVNYALVAILVVGVLFGAWSWESHNPLLVNLAGHLLFPKGPGWLVFGFVWAGLLVLADETFLASHPLWTRWCPRVFELLAWAPLAGFFLIFSFEVYPHFGKETGASGVPFDFEAVFYAVVQVYRGQALLVDFSHQYGLYPQLLEPLFRIVGLTAARFSLVMAALNGVSLYLLYRVTKEAGRNAAVAWGGLVLQVMLIYLPGYIDNLGRQPQLDPFYQFHPVRFLFPCLSVYLCWRYFSAPRRWLYWVCWALFSIGVLWNLDVGQVVFLAWLLVLGYGELCAAPWRAALRRSLVHALKGSLVLAGTLALFSLYLRARYGGWPDYARAVEFQRIFYLNGFYMLPMPLMGAWCVVALVYGFGLLQACRALQAGERTPRQHLVFFVSVLGCGVFSYYQGRSHIYCLFAVAYPAVVLVTLAASETFAAWRRKTPQNLGRAALGAFVLLVLNAFVYEMLLHAGDMFRPGVKNVLAACRGELSSETPHAGFLRTNFQPGEKALILSRYSGQYHLEAGTCAAVPSPGPEAMILQRDWDRVRDWLVHPHPGSRLVTDSMFLGYYRDSLCRAQSLLAYRLTGVNPYPAEGAHDRDLLIFEGPVEGGTAWLELALDRSPDTLRHYRVDGGTGAVYSREAGFEGRWYAAPLEIPAEFTLEMVAYPSMAEPKKKALVLANLLDVGKPAGFQVVRERNVWTFGFGDGQNVLGAVASSVPPGAWSYFAVSVTKDRIQMAANGEIRDEPRKEGAIASPKDGFLYFESGVEEARLLRRALSAEELKAHRQALAGKELCPLRLAPSP